MKKIILIVIALIIVIGGGYFLLKNKKITSYYPDIEGWNRKALAGDMFQSFFPLKLQEKLYLVSPNESGVFDSSAPTTSTRYVEFRDDSQINLGSREKPEVFKVLSAHRAFYALEGFEEMPVFKMWIEQVLPEDFTRYEKAVLAQLDLFSSSSNIEKQTYKGHNYYTYLRKDLSNEGLKGKNSIGGSYVLFPEKNIIMYIYLFNTRYNTTSAYLISKDGLNKVIEQFIDSTMK
jgi:hypothetical protein